MALAPNNLQQSGLGIKGKMSSWTTGTRCSTRRPASIRSPASSPTRQPPTPRTAACPGRLFGDRRRCARRPAFNDEFYGGASSTYAGTLTFGRQRSLGTDAMLAYDPAAGAYSFSYIGYNGTMAGGGDTEDSRWDQAVKYRIAYGPLHFGAMYKFADGSGGCYSASGPGAPRHVLRNRRKTAYGFDLGGEYDKFLRRFVFQHYNQAISVLNPLLGLRARRSPISRPPTASIRTPSPAPM